jgi:ABC-type transport system substrate-binding protein
MSRRWLWLLIGVIGAFSLVASAAAGPNGTPRRGGTVIYGLDQEPKILNGWITEGNLFATSEVTAAVFEGGLEYDNRAVLRPVMLTGQPQLIKRRPMTVRFTYKANAKWNDGRPVTGADYVFTWQTILNKSWDITSREGWEDMRRVTARGKTVTIVFSKPFADWKSYAGSGVLPRHVLRGQNFNQVWRNDLNKPGTSTPIANGPFKFERWQRGSNIVLSRNAQYWGPRAFLNQIQYKVVSDTNTQFQAIRSGEINVLRPQPQLQIADARRNTRLRVQSGPDFGFEHVDIQRGPKGHAALKRAYVRQALIRGINRQAVANALYRTIAPGLPVLNNLIFKPFQPQYQGHFRKWGFSRAAAERILRNNRCTKGSDGIYTCPQVGKLEFRFTSTAGNQLRELAFEIMQSQLKAAGIQLVSRFAPAATAFGTILPGRDWDLFMFTWVQTPTSYITDESIHGCNGDQNDMTYCNQRVTALLRRLQTELNERRRFAIANQADAIMANDIPSIPLFARPGFLIHERRIQGILRNPTTETTLFNANRWWVTSG